VALRSKPRAPALLLLLLLLPMDTFTSLTCTVGASRCHSGPRMICKGPNSCCIVSTTASASEHVLYLIRPDSRSNGLQFAILRISPNKTSTSSKTTDCNCAKLSVLLLPPLLTIVAFVPDYKSKHQPLSVVTEFDFKSINPMMGQKELLTDSGVCVTTLIRDNGLALASDRVDVVEEIVCRGSRRERRLHTTARSRLIEAMMVAITVESWKSAR
jgi:hypothetical protein